jgi:hypothetical protein
MMIRKRIIIKNQIKIIFWKKLKKEEDLLRKYEINKSFLIIFLA